MGGGSMGMMGGGMMNRMSMMNNGGGMMMMNNGGMMGGMIQPIDQSQQSTTKGKERFVELDDAEWQSRFAQAEESTNIIEIEQQIDSGKTLDDIASDTINALQGHIDATETDAKLMDSLEATWKNLESTLNTSGISDSEMAQWEAQYGAQFSDLNGDSGLGDEFAEFNNPRTWTMDNVDEFLANTEPYPFAEENDYLTHPDPFSEGQRLLSVGAPLSQAALAFEAACQRDPTRAEAWRAAGETWSADEREAKGIRALEKAVGCGGKDGVGAWMVRSSFISLIFIRFR
jgi:peroxin-5